MFSGKYFKDNQQTLFLHNNILPFRFSSVRLLFFLCIIMVLVIPSGLEGTKFDIVYIYKTISIIVIFSFFAIAIKLFAGQHNYIVFVQALFVRLFFLGIFYLFLPSTFLFPQFNITTPTSPVWDDDVHYVGSAEYINARNLSWRNIIFESDSLPFAQKVGQVGFIISFVKKYIGAEQVWVRFFHVLLGSLVAVIIVSCIQSVLSPATQKFGITLVILGPEFIQASILLYKEVYVHFSSAILLLSFFMIAKEKRMSIFSLLLALFSFLCFWWFRSSVLLIAVLFFALHVALWSGRISNRFANTIGFFILLAIIIMALLGIGPKAELITKVMEETRSLQGTSFGWTSTLSGFARIIHIPLSFLNPPPFLLHNYILIQPGDFSWFKEIFRELRTLQWWLMAPFVIFGIWAILKKFGRMTTFLLPYVSLWFVSAISFNGVGPEVVRYRDSFLPFAIVLALLGYEYAGKRFRKVAIQCTIFVVCCLWFFMNFR